MLVTMAIWLVADAAITQLTGVRGFSSFHAMDPAVGHINKPGFSGRFGGFLDSFSASVSIGPLGQRNSSPAPCDGVKTFLFMGDSTTAGFEVDDSETFVSVINRNCRAGRIAGVNFGVRAYDTHQVLANYKRIGPSIKHDAVLYLITENDLFENTQLYPYVNVAQHFGRTFNGEYHAPEISALRRAYLAFRIFVSDKFYVTTKAIELVQSVMAARSKGREPFEQIPEDQATALVQLVGRLAEAARNNNARLYVAAYPCMAVDLCVGAKVERLLQAAAGQNGAYVVLPLAIELEAKFNRNEISRADMHFYNDNHLSAVGHRVVASELSRLIEMTSR